MACNSLSLRLDRNDRSATAMRIAGTWGGLLLLALFSSGCISLAGDRLADSEPQTPTNAIPAIEQTIGDFSFHLDGGKLITSVKAGRNLNQVILDRWKKKGLITRQTYVKSSQFTGNADYNLELGGHQEGDSNIAMQILSGLTLFLLPYSVNTELELVYTLEHVESGRRFEAKAADSFRLVTSLLLLPATPFATGGMRRTYNRLADHLYNQLAEQGAFAPESWVAEPPGGEVGPGTAKKGDENAHPGLQRLRVLDRLRQEGSVTSEEYDRKKQEILRDL